MTIDHRLLEMLVCPLCKGPLEGGRSADGHLVELICHADRLAFPIHDGIPVMLEGEARAWTAEPPPPPALSVSGAA